MNNSPFVVKPLDEVQEKYPNFESGWEEKEGRWYNPGFGEVRHIVVCNRKTGEPIWDQPVHIEPVGAVSVPVIREGGVVKTIRLVEQFRPAVLPTGVEPSFPEVFDMEKWGRKFIDVPRGFPKRGEDASEAAKRETFEEGKSPVVELREIGKININATFFVHMVPVYLVEIDPGFDGEAPDDLNEKILDGDNYTVNEVKRKIAQNEIQDSMSLSALNLFFVSENI